MYDYTFIKNSFSYELMFVNLFFLSLHESYANTYFFLLIESVKKLFPSLFKYNIDCKINKVIQSMTFSCINSYLTQFYHIKNTLILNMSNLLAFNIYQE